MQQAIRVIDQISEFSDWPQDLQDGDFVAYDADSQSYVGGRALASTGGTLTGPLQIDNTSEADAFVINHQADARRALLVSGGDVDFGSEDSAVCITSAGSIHIFGVGSPESANKETLSLKYENQEFVLSSSKAGTGELRDLALQDILRIKHTGEVVIRQSGGSVGTDEAHLYHDGTNFVIDPQSGVVQVTGSITAGTGITISGTSNLNFGDSNNYIRKSGSDIQLRPNDGFSVRPGGNERFRVDLTESKFWSRNAAYPALTLIAHATQSGNVFEIQDSTETVVSYFEADGEAININGMRISNDYQNQINCSDYSLYGNWQGQVYFKWKSASHGDKILSFNRTSSSFNSGSGDMDCGTSTVPWRSVHTKTLYLTELPTEDPVSSGAIWNDSGTLKISAG